MAVNDYKTVKAKYTDLKKVSVRSVCNKKTFDNESILNEIIKTGSLKKLNSTLLSDSKIDLSRYNVACDELVRTISTILIGVDVVTTKLNHNQFIELAQHFGIHSKLPTLYDIKLTQDQRKSVIDMIGAYKKILLDIPNIGYYMCTTLYNVYTQTLPEKNEHKTEILRHIISDSIEHFDSNEYVKKNFELFQKKFKNTLQYIASQLDICVLPNYLYVAKTKDGLKMMKDVNGDELVYLKNLCAKFREINNEVNAKKSDLKNKIRDDVEKAVAYDKQIRNLMGDYYSGSNVDMVFVESLQKSKDFWMDYVKKEQKELDSLPDTKNHLEFEMPEVSVEKYREQLITCINNNRHVLVPVSLLDVTKSPNITSIKAIIDEKQNDAIAFARKLKLHANMLFINNEKKYVEYFEPHGTHGFYNITEAYNVVKNFHLALLPVIKTYTFVPCDQLCPIIYGPQRIDKSEYCYIHSGYYALLRILYPDYSSQEIGTMLISKPNKNFNKDTEITSHTDYLQRKYMALSGPEIKRRMENFMKWHRYMVEFNESPKRNIVEYLANIIKDIVPKFEYD